MKKGKLFAAAVTILALLFFGALFVTKEFQALQERMQQHEVTKITALLQQRVQQKHQDLERFMQKLLAQKELIQAISYEDRETIDLLVHPHYEALSKQDPSIKILTFRTKEGSTIYRAHKRELFGDALHKKRAIILDTDLKQRSLSGFEVGKFAITYRVTYPIFYKNEYVGNAEIGADPLLFLQDVKKVFGVDMGVAAYNRFLEVMQNRDALYIGDQLFLLQGSENLENYFLQNGTKNQAYQVKTSSLELQNHTLQTIGYIVLGFFTDKELREYKKHQERIIWFFLFALTLLSLFFVALFYRKEEKKERQKESLDLEKVLQEERMTPYFQPIVDTQANIVKYEAWMRIVSLEGSQKKVLLPEQFLQEAHRQECYIPLMQQMIHKSLYYFQEKKESIALNFLPEDLLNVSLMQEFVQNLKMFDTPQRVVVEISEAECAKNFSKLLQVAKKLKELGVAVCIDDYDGTALNYSTLLAINPHAIKINGALLATTAAVGYKQLYSMVQFAKENNIKIATDFVPDKETFELFKTYGIEEFQGYYFGEAREFLEEK